MRQLRHALIVAAAAAVVLVVVARAESLAQPSGPVETLQAADENPDGSSPGGERRPAAGPVRPRRKQFGASIRALPSSDAAVIFNTRCGDTWPVLTVERGWVKVRTRPALAGSVAAG